MAASTYDEALRRVLAHEGGYSNHPADPGGPTNFGITIYDYRKYVKPNATAADVQAMTVAEAKAIYRKRYWDALACDALPAGVDYAVFDYGVNSGIGRPGKVLRRRLGLDDTTSVITEDVIAAARNTDRNKLIIAICDERLTFLRSLKTWDVFGRGWAARVVEVKTAALAMAAEQRPSQRKPTNLSTSSAVGMSAASAGAAAHAAGFPPWIVVALAAAGASAAALLARLFAHRKDSTMWDRIKSWFKHSLTIVWARIVAAAGFLLALADGLLADGNVNAAIQQALQPKLIPYYVIAIGLITELARRRTAGRS